MKRRSLLGFFFAGSFFSGSLFFSPLARASTYFTPESVKHALFPGAVRFVDCSRTLSKAQKSAIAKASRSRVHSSTIAAFAAYGTEGRLGLLFIDKVYGKHEFITYALALDASGAVHGIEIMDYRESYGEQIRLPKWRAQFIGKRSGQPLEIDRQIKNISGATLSCVHITKGVRRLLVTYALLFA